MEAAVAGVASTRAIIFVPTMLPIAAAGAINGWRLMVPIAVADAAHDGPEIGIEGSMSRAARGISEFPCLDELVAYCRDVIEEWDDVARTRCRRTAPACPRRSVDCSP